MQTCGRRAAARGSLYPPSFCRWRCRPCAQSCGWASTTAETLKQEVSPGLSARLLALLVALIFHLEAGQPGRGGMAWCWHGTGLAIRWEQHLRCTGMSMSRYLTSEPIPTNSSRPAFLCPLTLPNTLGHSGASPRSQLGSDLPKRLPGTSNTLTESIPDGLCVSSGSMRAASHWPDEWYSRESLTREDRQAAAPLNKPVAASASPAAPPPHTAALEAGRDALWSCLSASEGLRVNSPLGMAAPVPKIPLGSAQSDCRGQQRDFL